ncbi:MAG: TIGR03000 domain-containing protein [Gemmata sp.]
MPYNYGSRVAIGIGIGSGYGLYGPPIGRPYNSFYAFGVPYNDGYGSLGYGYPSGFRGSNYGTFGVPLNPGTYYPDPQYRAVPQSPYPIEQVPAPQPAGDPNPVPLPLPPNGAGAGATEGTPATITVVASAGAKVTFDGIDTEQTGGRHSFTTRPIAPGAEKRVSIKVDGPGGPSTMVLSMRAGEKATVDMRK